MRNKKFLLLTMMLAMTVGTTACRNKEQENVSDTASQVTANEANEEVSDVEITEGNPESDYNSWMIYKME